MIQLLLTIPYIISGLCFFWLGTLISISLIKGKQIGLKNKLGTTTALMFLLVGLENLFLATEVPLVFSILLASSTATAVVIYLIIRKNYVLKIGESPIAGANPQEIIQLRAELLNLTNQRNRENALISEAGRKIIHALDQISIRITKIHELTADYHNELLDITIAAAALQSDLAIHTLEVVVKNY